MLQQIWFIQEIRPTYHTANDAHRVARLPPRGVDECRPGRSVWSDLHIEEIFDGPAPHDPARSHDQGRVNG